VEVPVVALQRAVVVAEVERVEVGEAEPEAVERAGVAVLRSRRRSPTVARVRS
jgi:hypothetical protein